MPQEFDAKINRMKTVHSNGVYLVLAETGDDTSKMGKILETYCLRSSGTQSQRFAYNAFLIYLRDIAKFLNF